MLLSIVIPTKNRYETLFKVVDTILEFDKNEDIEIVVQDNSDNNIEALSFIENRLNFSNLKYFYESGSLSVIENSDKAILNSTGKYVCFIGDDDGVMPYIVEIVKWMQEKRYRALRSYKPRYVWPGQKPNYLSKNLSGVLTINNMSYAVKIFSTRNALNNLVKRGGVNMGMMPCLYHGIVDRTTLNKIYEKHSSFFPGPSPDMASAVALSHEISSFTYLTFPVFISGKSAKSTGGAGIRHEHVGRIEDIKHLPKNTSNEWSSRIPKYWTAATISAESALQVLKKYNNQELIRQFNFSYLYASLFVFNSKSVDVLFLDFAYTVKTLRFYIAVLKIFILRIRFFIRNRFSPSINRVDNIKSIAEAIEFIEHHYVDRDSVNKFIE